jgi:hypothetical protein
MASHRKHRTALSCVLYREIGYTFCFVVSSVTKFLVGAKKLRRLAPPKSNFMLCGERCKKCGVVCAECAGVEIDCFASIELAKSFSPAVTPSCKKTTLLWSKMHFYT